VTLVTFKMNQCTSLVHLQALVCLQFCVGWSQLGGPHTVLDIQCHFPEFLAISSVHSAIVRWSQLGGPRMVLTSQRFLFKILYHTGGCDLRHSVKSVSCKVEIKINLNVNAEEVGV